LPFLRITIPAVAGVVLGDVFDFPWGWLAIAFAATLAVAWAMKRTGWSSPYVWVAVCLLYMLLSTWARPSTALPHGQRVVATAVVLEDPFAEGRWGRCDARVTAFRLYDPGNPGAGFPDTASADSIPANANAPAAPAGASSGNSLSSSDPSPWRSVSEKITLSVDTSYRVLAGDRIAFEGYFDAMGDGGYGRLMARRGFTARSYLTPGNLLYAVAPEGFSPRRLLAGIKKGASARLSRLGFGPDEEQIVQAMVLGSREVLSRQMRDDYARSGTTHILAVSGLHVAIVFLLINALLWFVPLFRRGHIAKNVIAVAAIWFYSLLTGMSPSVVRSAFMFTGVQLALAASARSQPLNTLLATAAVMLAISPNTLWDVSFQLSFAAVLFIMLWYTPLYRLVRTRWGAVNFISGAVLISVVATVGTAPLVAWQFGYFSVSGIVVNPVVTNLSYIILILPLVWIMAPLHFLTPVIRWPVEWAVQLQNYMAHWGAVQKWGVVHVSPSPFWLAATYAIFLLVTPLVARLGEVRERKNKAGFPV